MDMIANMPLELRLAMLAILVGGVVNVTKRIPKLPSCWVPFASVVMGFAATILYYVVIDLRFDLRFAIEAVATGSIPVAMHKIIKPLWVSLLGEESADRWLGQADNQPDDDDGPVAGQPGLTSIVLAVVLLCAPGCASLWEGLSALSAGAQGVATVLRVIEQKSDAYFDRHPSQEAEREVRDAIADVWVALAARDALVATGRAIEDRDLAATKRAVLDAYGALHDILHRRGIPAAAPPDGGAEGSGPLPEPFEIPAVADVGAWLGR
jgi:hypothetical protein